MTIIAQSVKLGCLKVDATCSECSRSSGALCEKCETNYSIIGNDKVTLQIDDTKLSNTTLKINEINYDDYNESVFYLYKYYNSASFNNLILFKNNNNTSFLLHNNIRSLPKNIDKIYHFISELKSYPNAAVPKLFFHGAL